MEIQAIALGKARERRIRDESVKLLREVQPVKVRSGQSLSRQAGSECCISSGDRRDEAYTARKQAARVQLRHRFIIATPTPLAWRKAASGRTDTARLSGVAGVPSPGHAFKWTSREPRRAPYLSRPGESVQPDPNGTRSQGNEGVPRGAKRPSTRSTCCQGRPEAAGTGRRAVVRTHSTREGGEPQGLGKGRERYPVEGRGEQVDASTKPHMRET